MPKIKVAFPLDKITGTIWGPDRTIGRDVGFASSIREINPKKNPSLREGFKSQLYATTAPTRGGSTARHLRAEVYWQCDLRWKALGVKKQEYLYRWWRAASGNTTTRLTNYDIFFKICLGGRKERNLFERFNFWSRFRIWNQTEINFEDHEVILEDIPYRRLDGADVEVYSLFAIQTKVGNKTYTAREIDSRLSSTVEVPGEALVIIPFLQSQTSMLVDVYSYFRS
jgi:hypothetical protein